MRFGFIVWLGMGGVSGRVLAQECPAVARLQPTGVLNGTLDAASCLLSDGSAYAVHRLDLPVRGQIRIELSGTSNDLALFFHVAR